MIKAKLRTRSLAVAAGALVLGLAVLVPMTASARSGAEPFKVRVIAGVNALASNAPELPVGAQAAAAVINKQGGLGGRPIEVSLCDHQATPSIGVQCANQAVADKIDDMICFSGSICPLVEAIMRQNGIPMVGNKAVGSLEMVSPISVPVTAPSLAQYTGSATQAMQQKGLGKGSRWYAVGQVSPATTLIIGTVKTYAIHHGINWVGQVIFPPSTDLTAYAQQVKDANPDVVFIPVATLVFQAFVAAAQQIGLKAKLVEGGDQVAQTDVNSFADKGANLLLAGSVPPPSATSVPAVKLWLDQLKAIGQYKPENLKQPSMEGWLDMWALKKLADRTKGAITGAALLATARKPSTVNIDMFGLFKWSPGAKGPAPYPYAPNDAVWLWKVVNGQIVLAQKNPVHAWQQLGIARK